MNTIAAYAKGMKDFLEESELTERRAFIESFGARQGGLPAHRVHLVPIRSPVSLKSSSIWTRRPPPPTLGGGGARV